MFTRRLNVLASNDYFMAAAKLVALRSPDPNTQVGACIVDKQNHIIGLGCNEFPDNCSNDAFPWARQAASPLDTKYFYIVHAEVNAILKKTGEGDLKGSRIFVTLFPCNECAKMIINSGISEVIYASDKYAKEDNILASKRMFNASGVACTQFVTQQDRLEINFTAD